MEVVRAQKTPKICYQFHSFWYQFSRKREAPLHLLNFILHFYRTCFPVCLSACKIRELQVSKSETRWNYVSRRSFRIRYRFAAHKQRGPPGGGGGGGPLKNSSLRPSSRFPFVFPCRDSYNERASATGSKVGRAPLLRPVEHTTHTTPPTHACTR